MTFILVPLKTISSNMNLLLSNISIDTQTKKALALKLINPNIYFQTYLCHFMISLHIEFVKEKFLMKILLSRFSRENNRRYLIEFDSFNNHYENKIYSL